MIAVSANDGVLRVQAELRIPSAESGTWSPERQARLAELINEYRDAAELVDDAERQNRYAKSGVKDRPPAFDQRTGATRGRRVQGRASRKPSTI